MKRDATAPTNALSIGVSSGAALLSGTNLYYKNNTAGSLTIANALTDATSGPASATFPVISSLGMTHNAPATVSTPTGGPFVSTAYSWTNTATFASTTSLTGTDSAGNINAGTTITFVPDSTGPTGTVTASGTSGSISLTASVTDAGSGAASVAYYRCTGTLATCSTSPPGAAWTLIGTSSSGGTWPVPWDSTTVANTTYSLEAVMTDNLGNTATTAGVQATVANSYTFVVSNPGNQVAGTAFGGFTIQLQANGVSTGNLGGSSYAGARTITWSGTAMAAAPNGTVGTPASTSLTFNASGQATVPASTVTAFKAATGVVLTATDSGNSVAGTTGTFNVTTTTTATKLAWAGVSAATGALSSPCFFTCTDTGLGNNQSISASVSITDTWGNPVNNTGAALTITVTITTNNSGGAFTAPGSGATPRTLTVATGAATTSTPFTYKAGNTGTWTDVLTATAGGFTNATMTLTKQ